MVAIRLHRIGSAGLAESPPRVAAQRVSAEIAVDQGGDQSVRLHRIAVCILAKSPTLVAPQRVSTEVAADEGGEQEIRLHRVALTPFAKAPPRVGVQRVSAEVAADEGGNQAVRLHRISYTILARGALPPPEPIALADNLHFFMHNWVDRVVIETAYQTDVFRSPSTGAEERTSRTQRPDRMMELYWMRESQDEIHQLLKLLRRFTEENLQVPIYPDVVTVTSAITALDTSLSCNTRNRRFFVGARVLVFPITLTHVTAADATIRTIESLTGSSLTLTAALGLTESANKMAVVPLMDCEIALEPEVLMQTDTVGEVRLTVREIHSKNALPPFSVGNPDGAQIRNGRPIFEPDPNWISGLKTNYIRYGVDQRQGLRLVPSVEGERFVLATEFNLSPLDRDEWGHVAGFFDSRRGRSRSFWVVDRSDNYVPITNLASSVQIEPYGDFADFEKYWLEEHVGAGFVMKDGTIYTVTVFSVTDNVSTWQLTFDLGQTLPILDMTQVSRFGRARLSRFTADAMRETWETNEICQINLSTIEVPNEKEVEFE